MRDDKLKLVAKMAWQRAKEKIAQGEAPQFLGVNGLVALMYERLVQFGKTQDNDMVLELAADAIIALDLATPELAELEDTQEPQQEETEEDVDPAHPEDDDRRIDPTEGGRFMAVKPGEEAPTTNESSD